LALDEDGHPLITKILTKITLPLADYITFVSKKVEESFFGDSVLFDKNLLKARKHFTIYNGIDLEEIAKFLQNIDKKNVRSQLGIESDDLFLVNVGRLTLQKGQKYLIEAMTKVVKLNSRVKLIIFGEGELKEELQKLISKYSLKENIKILQPRRDIIKVLASADLFVFPSLWEGFSMVLVEAMAVGIPIIATNVTGINEIVINGINGILVKSKDSESLANAIIKLIYNKEEREYLALNAKKTVGEKFNLDKIVDEYELLYR